MGQVFKTQRRVEFRDTDMAGIVHFSVFFVYMEQAEHELLRSLELGVMMEVDGRSIGFPRVNAQCNYRSPIRFEDILDIEVTIQKIGEKSVTFAFQFSTEGRPVADGQITTACCELLPGGPRGTPIPAEISSKLAPFVVD